jgi:TetR/AcrR family fatty acid metabolism transcriptional regulator
MNMTAAKTQNLRKNQKAPKNPAKRLAILEAAESIFSKRGFQGATVSDIAKKAHVSEATIYEYFSTKEELLFSIPGEKILEYQTKNREILQYIQGSTNKLRFLIYRHLQLYASDSDYARVVMLTLKTNRNFLNTEAYKVVQASARNTIEVLQEGIKNGEFRPDIQPYLVRAMIWGTIEHLVIRKSMLGKPEDLLCLADEITNTIFHGILAPRKETALNVHVTMDQKK